MKLETAASIVYGPKPVAPPQSLAIVPQGDAWQAVTPTKSIQAILESIIATCDAMNREIEAIKYTLENLPR
jgi:hypothetical protein